MNGLSKVPEVSEKLATFNYGLNFTKMSYIHQLLVPCLYAVVLDIISER